MPAAQPALFSAEQSLLADFGDRLRAARLRRKFSADTVAARAGISRMTLFRAEKGEAAVSLGTYLRILEVLRLEKDIELLAKDDVLGRRLQDLDLPAKRGARRAKPAAESGA